MNDRFRFRTPIYGADGKFKKFVYWPAVYGAPAVTCRFRYKNNRPAPVSVLGLGKKANTYDICSLEGICILQSVSEKFLYPTKEEAENEK